MLDNYEADIPIPKRQRYQSKINVDKASLIIENQESDRVKVPHCKNFSKHFMVERRESARSRAQVLILVCRNSTSYFISVKLGAKLCKVNVL